MASARPISSFARDYVSYYELTHRPDELIAALREHFPEEPVFPLYHMMKGDLAAARRQMEERAANSGGRPDDLDMSYLLALEGDKKGSEELLARVIRETAISPRATFYHHFTYDIACIYAINGNGPEAMKWLRTTADTGFRSHTLFARDPFLDKIRGLPQFGQFMSETAVEHEKLRTEFY